jgi:metallophosphoesterase (TIGR03767 family)
MRRRGVIIVLVAAAVATATVNASHLGGEVSDHTTVDVTITGGDPAQGFATLGTGPGEPYTTRETLAPANSGRANRRDSLIYSGQITDFQLADEESPAREERFDSDPFRRVATSGHRPQETLVVHEVELTIRQMNRFTKSPVKQGNGKRANLANAVMTGDLADNMQRNETEWVLRLVEGGTLNPNSGTSNLAGTKCPPGTPLDDPANYTGVQDFDDYSPDNPIFYDPELPLGVYADRGWPTYPGLLDRAQQPFQAEGLAVPSYIAFGNHDGLYQGTVQASPGLVTPGATFEQTAVDCLKPVYPLSNSDSATALFSPDFLEQVLTSDPDKVMQVPPDINRQFVDHPQFKNIFAAGQQADDHGFAYVDAAELQASAGVAAYYSFRPEKGIRFIVLDTLSEAGVLVTPTSQAEFASGSEGNIDDPQFRWLRGELNEAEKRDELVIAWGHHAVGSLTVENPDEAAPCTGVTDQHGHDTNPSCDLDPRSSSPVHTGEDLEELFLAHPHVIAYVAGHSHENRIRAVEAKGKPSGFWEIKSPAIADFPPQHRLIEVMDNLDGTLSIFGTMLDFDAPVSIPSSGTDVSAADIGVLGAIARTITFNDPQQGGTDGADGELRDRNVELLLGDPRRGKRGRCANLRLGGPGRDRLRGTKRGDRLRGRGGRDRLQALAGRDCLSGGRGLDRMNGGRGRDRLNGGRGSDRLKGRSGRDRLKGGRGRDRISGGRGRDVIRSAGDTRDVVRCGRGRDKAIVDRRDRVRGCEKVRRR